MRAGAGPSFGRRRGARLAGSEPFVLTAMVSLVGGMVWHYRERELLLGHFYRPEFLSITHTLTLGWISMLMMGVLVRLGPRALGVEIRSRRWLAAQFACMFVGYTGMVFHFWVSGWVAMASAAILIVIAAAIQLYNFSGVFRRVRGPDWLARYVAAALVHFLLAAILGVLLGFNKVYDVLGGEFFPNIFAHAHLAAVGWVTMMIVGFEHRLLPSSRPQDRSARGAAARFVLLEVGLVGVVVGLVARSRLVPLFGALIVAALAAHAARPLALLARRKAQDRATVWATVALLFLLADAAAGLLLGLDIPGAESRMRVRVQLAYGYVGLLGWITLTITALAHKLFPMFVWEERFGELWGKEPVPAMRDLYSPHLQVLSHSFLALGIAGTAAAILAGYLPLITFFHGMAVIGVAAFVLNFFLMARWALFRKRSHPTPEDWASFRANLPNLSVRPGFSSEPAGGGPACAASPGSSDLPPGPSPSASRGSSEPGRSADR